MRNSRVNLLLPLAMVFIISGSVTYWFANLSTRYNIPKGSMRIGIGPQNGLIPVGTRMIFTVSSPHDLLNLDVSFKFTELKKYHIYITMPYVVSNANPCIEHLGYRTCNETSNIGNISVSFRNFEDKGSSVINASFLPSNEYRFLPDEVITLSIEASISGLVSINHPWDSKQTVILTFFGDQYGVWDDAMAPYIGGNSRGMLDYPFRVIVQFPRENYLSSDTFPSPIELFVTERFRSTMFDLDFSYPEGYAQSISCSYINPQNESNRGFLTFLSGVAITTGIALCVELCLQSSKQKRPEGEKKISNEEKHGEEEEIQESYDATIIRLIHLVDSNKSKLFRSLDFFRGNSTFPFITIMVFLGLIEIYLFFGDAPSADKITIAISFLAFAVAYLSLSAYFAEANIVEVNFKRLERCVEENEKPLLKALIKIKAKHTEFDLEQIHNMNPSMFAEEELLEKLYD